MNIIYMGTPDLARTVLRSLLESEHKVVAVVTQPDKPKGRGYELTPPPVKVEAMAHDIPVYQPQTLKNGELQPILDEYKPDAIVVAAYGKLLPPYVIDYGRFGCINVHGSLLPEYRGAAPIQRAIMDGKTKTGITIMKMDYGLDTGDMISKAELDITATDNFETIHDKLAELGGELVCSTLNDMEKGEFKFEKQPEEGSSYAKKIEKSDCLLDLTLSARQLHCIIRGLSPIPLSFAYLNGKMVKIIEADYDEKQASSPAGTVVSLDKKGIGVATGSGILYITRLLPEGKGRMNASDFINGRRVSVGDVFTNTK